MKDVKLVNSGQGALFGTLSGRNPEIAISTLEQSTSCKSSVIRFAAKDGSLDHSRDVSSHQVLSRRYYYSTIRFFQMVW
jgi:hypothetical protein